MGLLDGVGDAVKGASELTAPIAPGLGEAIKTALDGPLGHVEGAAGNPMDALNQLSGLQVNLAPILSALDHPAIDATAESALNSLQGALETQQSSASQANEVLQGVIENLHSNADSAHDGDATVVAMAESADGHASAHADTDSSPSHVDAPPAHEDAATSDPSANSA